MSVGKVPRLPSSNYLLLWISLMSLTSAMTLAPVKYNSHRASSSAMMAAVLSPVATAAATTLLSQRHQSAQVNDQEDQIRPLGDTLSVQLLPKEFNQEEENRESKEEHCVPLYSLGKDDTPNSPESNEHFQEVSPVYYYMTDNSDKEPPTYSPGEMEQESLQQQPCKKVVICVLNATTNFPVSCKLSERTACNPKSNLSQQILMNSTGFLLCNVTSLKIKVCDNHHHQSVLLEHKSLMENNGHVVPKSFVCICPFGYKGPHCDLIDTELFFIEPPEKFQSQNEIKEILLKYQQTDRYFIGVTLMALLMLTFIGVLGVVACCTYIFVRLSFTFMQVMVLDEARVRSGERVHRFEQQNYLSPLDRMKLCCASRDIRDDAVELELRTFSI